MRKKLLSILLALCMVLALFPVAAFAAGEEVDLDISCGTNPCTHIAHSNGDGSSTTTADVSYANWAEVKTALEAEDLGTIYIDFVTGTTITDLTKDDEIEIGSADAEVTIDLSGSEITLNNADDDTQYRIFRINAGTVAIGNGTLTGTGNAMALSVGAIIDGEDTSADVTLSGVTVTTTGSSSDRAIQAYAGTLEMTDCDVTAGDEAHGLTVFDADVTITDSSISGGIGIYVSTGGSVEISVDDGESSVSGTNPDGDFGSGIAMQKGATVTINAGVAVDGEYGVTVYGGVLESAGDITGDIGGITVTTNGSSNVVGKADITVTGGTVEGGEYSVSIYQPREDDNEWVNPVDAPAIEISGGTYTGEVVVGDNKTGAGNVNGDEEDVEVEEATDFISGGTFSDPVDTGYLSTAVTGVYYDSTEGEFIYANSGTNSADVAGATLVAGTNSDGTEQATEPKWETIEVYLDGDEDNAPSYTLPDPNNLDATGFVAKTGDVVDRIVVTMNHQYFKLEGDTLYVSVDGGTTKDSYGTITINPDNSTQLIITPNEGNDEAKEGATVAFYLSDGTNTTKITDLAGGNELSNTTFPSLTVTNALAKMNFAWDAEDANTNASADRGETISNFTDATMWVKYDTLPGGTYTLTIKNPSNDTVYTEAINEENALTGKLSAFSLASADHTDLAPITGTYTATLTDDNSSEDEVIGRATFDVTQRFDPQDLPTFTASYDGSNITVTFGAKLLGDYVVEVSDGTNPATYYPTSVAKNEETGAISLYSNFMLIDTTNNQTTFTILNANLDPGEYDVTLGYRATNDQGTEDNTADDTYSIKTGGKMASASFEVRVAADGLTVETAPLGTPTPGQVNLTITGATQDNVYYRVVTTEPASAPNVGDTFTNNNSEWHQWTAITAISAANNSYIEAVSVDSAGKIAQWGKSAATDDGYTAPTPVGGLTPSVNVDGTITLGGTAAGTFMYAVVDSDPSSTIDTWNTNTTVDNINSALSVTLSTDKPSLDYDNNGDYLLVVDIKDGKAVSAGVAAITGLYKITIDSAETPGGAGLYRTVTIEGLADDSVTEYAVIQITIGTTNSIVMVEAQGTLTVSYTESATVEVWLTSGMPDLVDTDNNDSIDVTTYAYATTATETETN